MEKPTEEGRVRRGFNLRNLNRKYPWLKILVVILMVELLAGLMLPRLIENGMIRLEFLTEARMENEKKKMEEEKSAQQKEMEKERLKKERLTEEERLRKEEERLERERQQKLGREARMEELRKKTTGKKLVALSFDDGPNLETLRLLNILKEREIRTTFFVLGRNLERFPEVAKRALAEGHELQSHSVHHDDLSKMKVEGVLWDERRMNELFWQILGQKPTMLRPPYGAISQLMYQTMSIPLMLWSVDSEDWKFRNSEVVRAKVRASMFDGAVVLMHDIHPTSVDAVPGIIDDLIMGGYEIVTVSELAELRGVKSLEKGYAYGSFAP